MDSNNRRKTPEVVRVECKKLVYALHLHDGYQARIVNLNTSDLMHHDQATPLPKALI